MDFNFTTSVKETSTTSTGIKDVNHSSTPSFSHWELTTMSTVADSTIVHLNISRVFEATNHDTNVLDYDMILTQENTFEAKVLTPVTVYLVLLMVFGILGNSVVLYIYKVRFRRSTSRIFILSLAVFDFITCLLGMPYHIMDMVYPYMFVWNTACKVMSFALSFTILASIFTLNMIAVDRYRKICRPLHKQLSGMGSKVLSCVMGFIALLSAIPMIFIYGSADIPTRIPNVTGKECYISGEYADTSLPIVYNIFVFLLFIVSVFMLIGFYSRVAATVWKRRKFTESSNYRQRSISSQTTHTSVSNMNVISGDVTVGTAVHAHFTKDDDAVVHVFDSNSSALALQDSSPYTPTTSALKQDRVVYKKKLLRLMSDPSSAGNEHDLSGVDLSSTLTSSHAPERHFVTKKQKRTLRITVMLFIITVIFIVSFLPYLVISILDVLDEEFWNDLSVSQLVLYNLLLRTYFINNMINPIIYWFLDHKFKEEVRRFFGNIRKCNKTVQRPSES